jgi:hypothetical protein
LKALTGLTLFLEALTFSFCGTHNDKDVKEGIIEYDVKPVNENHPLAGFAPTSAVFKFKKDKFIMEMSIMGMFNTMFIADPVKRTLTQMVKFLDLKQACIEDEKDIKGENEKYQLKIEETKETKIIAGHKCHKIKVTMVSDPTTVFDAYYTKDIQADNVNALSPYSSVKGMMMQYRLQKLGLELEFTAKAVKAAEIPDATFEIPAYFKIVSKAEMQKYFDSLQ